MSARVFLFSCLVFLVPTAHARTFAILIQMISVDQAELEVDWEGWFRREFAGARGVEIVSLVANHPDRLKADLAALELGADDRVARVFVVGHGGHYGKATPRGIMIHSHLDPIEVVAGDFGTTKTRPDSPFHPLAGKYVPDAQVYLHACNLTPSEPGLACAVGQAWADALGMRTGALFIAYTQTLTSTLFVTKPFWRYARRVRAPAAMFQLAAITYVGSAIYNPELTHRPLYWAVPVIYFALRASVNLIFNRGFKVTLKGLTDSPEMEKMYAWEFRHMFRKNCARYL